MVSLNLNELLNRFLDWKTTLILHCGNNLLAALYKRCLKFKENVPENGRTTSNSFFGTVSTICLGTYNLSRKSLKHWSILFTVQLFHLKILLMCCTSV